MKTFRQAVKEASDYSNVEDGDDCISMTVPLFICLMEYAREQAKSDYDVHVIAEKATAQMNDYDVLTMKCYDDLIAKESK